MITRQIRLFGQGIVAGCVLGLSAIVPVLAQQNLLTHAEVYKLVNQVQLLLRNQPPRPAKISDVIIPQDGLRTAARSTVELLFNEGSLARLGANAMFRFIPGTRSFQLSNGTVLVIFRPGSGGGKIITPEAIVVGRGMIMWVRHDSASQTTLVGALTNNPDRSVVVSSAKGEGEVQLRAGQRVSIIDGVVGPVKSLNLQTFYQTCELAAGLGPGQEKLVAQESPEVQETLKAVRVETLAALTNQLLQPDTNSDNFRPCPPQKEEARNRDQRSDSTSVKFGHRRYSDRLL